MSRIYTFLFLLRRVVSTPRKLTCLASALVYRFPATASLAHRCFHDARHSFLFHRVPVERSRPSAVSSVSCVLDRRCSLAPCQLPSSRHHPHANHQQKRQLDRKHVLQRHRSFCKRKTMTRLLDSFKVQLKTQLFAKAYTI